MFDKEKQSQKAGDGSSQFMANTINVGLDYSQVKEVALDTFKANFRELSVEATEIVNERVNSITDEIISKLQSSDSFDISKAKQPSFQYSLLDVQKEYAKSGMSSLKEILKTLFVNKVNENQHSTVELILDEAIKKASMLSQAQLNSLTLSWVFRHTVNNVVSDFDSLLRYLDICIGPLVADLPRSGTVDTLHLLYSGAAIELSHSKKSLVSLFQMNYPTAFYEHVDLSELDSLELPDNIIRAFFKKNAQGTYFFKVKDYKDLDERLVNLQQSEVILQKSITAIKKLFQEKVKFNEPLVKERLIEARPYMKDLINSWEECLIYSMFPTSVGIALAHTNISLHTNQYSTLEKWLK